MLLPQWSKRRKTQRVGFVVLCFCWMTFVVNAQDDAPVHPVDGKYIKAWLLLGPFFPKDLEKDFLASVGGEADVNPKEGDTVTTADGKTLIWKRSTERNFIHLIDEIGDDENVTAYVFCRLQSETAEEAEIHLHFHHGVALFLNGEQVYHKPGGYSDAYDRLHDAVSVNLKAGLNRCLVKLPRPAWGGDWGVAMRVLPSNRAVISGVITHEEGYSPAGTTVRLKQKDETIDERQTDGSGTYRFAVYPVVNGGVDVLAMNGELGEQRLGIPLQAGDRRKIDLTLKRAISIEVNKLHDWGIMQGLKKNWVLRWFDNFHQHLHILNGSEDLNRIFPYDDFVIFQVSIFLHTRFNERLFLIENHFRRYPSENDVVWNVRRRCLSLWGHPEREWPPR